MDIDIETLESDTSLLIYKETQAYLTYVCPKLEFTSTEWNPYHQKDIHTIEMVQCHITHFVTKTYNRYSSVTTIMSQLHWENLQDRRSKVLVYKIINELVVYDFATSIPGQGNINFQPAGLYTISQFA